MNDWFNKLDFFRLHGFGAFANLSVYSGEAIIAEMYQFQFPFCRYLIILQIFLPK